MWEYVIKVDTRISVCFHVAVMYVYVHPKHKADGTWFTLGHVTRNSRRVLRMEELAAFGISVQLSHECLCGGGGIFSLHSKLAYF